MSKKPRLHRIAVAAIQDIHDFVVFAIHQNSAIGVSLTVGKVIHSYTVTYLWCGEMLSSFQQQAYDAVTTDAYAHAPAYIGSRLAAAVKGDCTYKGSATLSHPLVVLQEIWEVLCCRNDLAVVRTAFIIPGTDVQPDSLAKYWQILYMTMV
jgi:hypothetical protein